MKKIVVTLLFIISIIAYSKNILNQDGDKYIGVLKNGELCGKWSLICKNGNKYTGEFKESKFEGKCTIILKNGYKYVGEFKNNKFISK